MDSEKLQESTPFEKFIFFKEQLGLNEDDLNGLSVYRSVFASRKDEFAGFLYKLFQEINQTRMVLEHERDRGKLQAAWAEWFESLFTAELDEPFLNLLWRSGLRHVEVNLEQQFLNLGYGMTRQFCQNIISTEIPASARRNVSLTVNRMLDLCLCVEASAYSFATRHCDREIMKGVSHQLRNPVTVIGGNARRLQNRVERGSEIYTICDNIITESRRLERLVLDIGEYIRLFQNESKQTIVPLEKTIRTALRKLAAGHDTGAVIDVDLDPAYPNVQGDRGELETMMYYLLENSIEAVPSENPYIKITSKVDDHSQCCLHVEIFNTGFSPRAEDIDVLFTPFSSSKSAGTGFGLPIAQLAARKNQAEIELLPVPGEGTSCIIHLPLPG